MSESFPEAGFMASLAQQAGQLGAMISEASRPERYEYAQVLWGGVNDLAREGWQVVPCGPWPVQVAWEEDSDTVAGGKVERRGTQPGFLMVRKLGAGDEAEDLLRAGLVPADLAAGIADGSIPVVEYPNEAGQ